MKKFLILLFIAACLIAMVPGVSATTYDGTVGQSVGWIQTNYNASFYGGNAMLNDYIQFKDIEYSTQLKTILHFDDNAHHASFTDFYGPNGAQTDIWIYNGIYVVGQGQMGYQRLYDNAWPIPNEIHGFQYITLDNWNITGLSGNVRLTMSYNHTKLNGWNFPYYGAYGACEGSSYSGITSGVGFMMDNYFKCPLSGIWTMNQDIHFVNTYHVEKSDATNQLIVGTLAKTDGAGRGIIYDGSTGAALTSEGTISQNQFNYTVVQNVTSIIIGSRDATSHFWNSSVLSFGALPTPTLTASPIPTPYPTGTPGPYADPRNLSQTPLAAGLTRTIVTVHDADTTGLISGLNIAIKDIGAGTWHNATADPDGIWWIDTIPADTIMTYITDPSGVYQPFHDTIPLPTSPTAGMGETYGYDLVKVSPGGGGVPGTVQLYIYSRDSDNHNQGISNALVTICPAGYCNTFSSDLYGNMHINATNNTDVTVTSSKTGYIASSITFNTGENATHTEFIYLHSATATTSPTKTGVIPTKTVITGNATPIPTTTPQQYTGFWGGLADGLSAMGAHPSEIGILLAGILIFIGFVVGGWSSAAYSPVAVYNVQASVAGGILGFVLSCAFGFIPLVFVIIISFVGVFVFIFFKNV